MTECQAIALRLLKTDLRRDLYEGSNGNFWITYTADESYEPLTQADISELLATGAIRRKWEDCDGFFILDKTKERMK